MLRVVRVGHQAATRRDCSALLRLFDVLKHLLTLGILLEDLVELFGASELVELDFEVLDAAAKTGALLADLLDQLLIDLHHYDAVFAVLGLLTRQFIVKCVDRLLKELHLHFVLLLDVAVLDHDLLVMLVDIDLEFGQNTHLQLLVVVNVLGDPVDGVLERFNVAILLSDLRIGFPDGRLHVFLLEAQILHDEAQVGVK